MYETFINTKLPFLETYFPPVDICEQWERNITAHFSRLLWDGNP